MKFLKAGQKVEIEVPEGATLKDALALIGIEYIDGTVFRNAKGPLDLDDPVSNDDLVLAAKAESNG